MTTLAHACAYLDSLQQKTLETLKLYNYRYSFYHHLVTGKEARKSKEQGPFTLDERFSQH